MIRAAIVGQIKQFNLVPTTESTKTKFLWRDKTIDFISKLEVELTFSERPKSWLVVV